MFGYIPRRKIAHRETESSLFTSLCYINSPVWNLFLDCLTRFTHSAPFIVKTETATILSVDNEELFAN